MKLPQPLRRPEVLWLIAAAVVVVLVAAWALGTVVVKYRAAATQIADIDPRYAQLAGMRQNQNAFAKDGEKLQANLAEFVYPADQDPSQIANTALSQVRELAVRHQLSVTSSQTAPARDDHGFDHIGLTLSVEGTWPAVVALLGDMAKQQPAVYYSTIQLTARPSGGRDSAPTRINAQLDLYVLKGQAS